MPTLQQRVETIVGTLTIQNADLVCKIEELSAALVAANEKIKAFEQTDQSAGRNP